MGRGLGVRMRAKVRHRRTRVERFAEQYRGGRGAEVVRRLLARRGRLLRVDLSDLRQLLSKARLTRVSS